MSERMERALLWACADAVAVIGGFMLIKQPGYLLPCLGVVLVHGEAYRRGVSNGKRGAP